MAVEEAKVEGVVDRLDDILGGGVCLWFLVESWFGFGIWFVLLGVSCSSGLRG
jgi:hypothetical protein